MTETPARRPPFIIVGAHRTGTTMLRCMLCATGGVFIPPESDFITRFFTHPNRPVTRRRAAAVLKALSTEHRYRLFARDWKPAVPTVGELLGGADRLAPGAFLDRLFSHYAAGYGAARWGDKTPIYTAHVPLLAALLPEARFVHLIRDGRDVAMSTVEQWGHEWHTDLHASIRHWARRVRAAQKAGDALGPDRYREVRYEDLVRSPEPTLRALCGFLGEAFGPAMIDPSRAAGGWFEKDNRFHHRLHAPVDDSRCARWRREMSASDLAMCEAAEGETLASLGYPLAAPAGGGPSPLRMTGLGAKYAATRMVRESLALAQLRPPA